MGIPKDSDFEGQWDLITGLPHDMGEIDSSLGAHKQNLAYTKTQGKGAVTPQETEPKLPARVGGLRGGMGWQGLTVGPGALAASGWEGPRWCKPSSRPPLPPPQVPPIRKLTHAF